jgi:DNA polymerase-4
MIRPERTWPKIVAHADMDAFYAAVEQLDDPALRGRPVLVGSPSARGVVLTASYEARPYGVGSAMPMARARRLCPQALIIPPHFDRYQEVSGTIMQVLSNFSPEVEAISLDEAFLEMTGSEHFFGGPERIGLQVKTAIREATGGLTASVGLSATKYVAKVASNHQKPDGLTVVPPGEAKAWLAPLPVSRLWGAGPKNQARLYALGLHTIEDVASADPEFLFQKLGKLGLHFHALAHAQDPRPVLGHRRSKSIGSESTLEKDVRERCEIEHHLRRSADTIAKRLRKKGHLASGVAIKLKPTDFRILTRQRLLRDPTDVGETLHTVGVRLLEEIDHPGPFRLVGMTAYDLMPIGQLVQPDLFGSTARQHRLETAIDALCERFGTGVMHRASDLVRSPGLRMGATLDFLDDETFE